MNNKQTSKKVMPEDIDQELVEQILHADTHQFHSESCRVYDRAAIRATLAWIANNPIQATYKDIAALEQNELSVLDRVSGNTLTPARAATCWQRIAFLKKEEELPQQVKALLFNGATSDAEYYNKANDCIIAAYKLGKGLK